MNDLTALTPPFLMAAVVITAIVMFLRHEMKRGAASRPEDGEDATPAGPAPGSGQDSQPGDAAAASNAQATAPARDR